MTNYRFSLRGLLIAVAVVAAVASLYRYYVTSKVLLRVEVDPAMQPCWVYLDDKLLGPAPLNVSVATAQALGIGRPRRSSTLGVFFTDLPRDDGRVPLLHVRRTVSQGSVRDAFLRDEVMRARIVWCDESGIGYEQSVNNDGLRQDLVRNLQVETDRIQLNLAIPPEIVKGALESQEGVCVMISGISLFDGTTAHWTFLLKTPAEFENTTFQLHSAKLKSMESTILLVDIRDGNNRAIKGRESYSDGFMLLASDPRWLRQAKVGQPR